MSFYQSETSQLRCDAPSIFDSISQKSPSEYLLMHCPINLILPHNRFLNKFESFNIDENVQGAVWEAFGRRYIILLNNNLGHFIRKQLKQGKSVVIPRLGKFTFPFNTNVSPFYLVL